MGRIADHFLEERGRTERNIASGLDHGGVTGRGIAEGWKDYVVSML